MDVLYGVRMVGPLTPYASGFHAELTRLGYTWLSARCQLRLVAHLSRWLADHGLGVVELTAPVLREFLAARRAAGYTAWLTPMALEPFLGYLRGLGVVSPVTAAAGAGDAAQVLLDRYRGYLLGERGLAEGTADWCVGRVRGFVTAHVASDDADNASLCGLTSADVAAFVLETCRDLSPKSAQQTASAMRSLLRFLHYDGVLPVSLLDAVPKVANRERALPRFVPPEQVQRLLASCDRDSAIGRRDLAMMMVMVRLGLRAGEVAALALDDLDWRHGEITVRGKGPRIERLPLPADVGQAITQYLQHGRPATALDRCVFVRVNAPHRGLSGRGVSWAVRCASRRADLEPMGSHRLRHSAATAMLHAGASLAEIGLVLRHQRARTTTIYATVDTERLRTLARPWPVVGVS
jgi:integrase/recombinase XerD